MDFVIYGRILRAMYEATAHLWRPIDQINLVLMYMVTLVAAAAFGGL